MKKTTIKKIIIFHILVRKSQNHRIKVLDLDVDYLIHVGIFVYFIDANSSKNMMKCVLFCHFDLLSVELFQLFLLKK